MPPLFNVISEPWVTQQPAGSHVKQMPTTLRISLSKPKTIPSISKGGQNNSCHVSSLHLMFVLSAKGEQTAPVRPRGSKITAPGRGSYFTVFFLPSHAYHPPAHQSTMENPKQTTLSVTMRPRTKNSKNTGSSPDRRLLSLYWIKFSS